MHSLHRLELKVRELASQVRASFFCGAKRGPRLLGEDSDRSKAAVKKTLEAITRKNQPMQSKGLQYAHINVSHAGFVDGLTIGMLRHLPLKWREI